MPGKRGGVVTQHMPGESSLWQQLWPGHQHTVVCTVERQLQLLLAWLREALPCLSCTARLLFWPLKRLAACIRDVGLCAADLTAQGSLAARIGFCFGACYP